MFLVDDQWFKELRCLLFVHFFFKVHKTRFSIILIRLLLATNSGLKDNVLHITKNGKTSTTSCKKPQFDIFNGLAVVTVYNVSILKKNTLYIYKKKN